MTEHVTDERDPLGRSRPAELIEHFAPLGANLRLETNSPEVVEACRTSFGRYGPPALSDPATPKIVIRLLVDPEFKEIPPWPDPVFRGHREIFYICVGNQNTAVANLDQGNATGFVTPAMARDTVFFRNTFLECLVLTLLTHGKASTHSYVHASAVARAHRGLIFCGPSQSGKSTLAFACARRGFRVVSDDAVYLRAGTNGLQVWGRPWHLRFLSDCVRFFPELKENAAWLRFDGNDCVEIDIERVLPGQTQTRCAPEAVLFLDRSRNRVSCESMESGKALELLAQDLVYDLPEVMERHRRFWFNLVQKRSYILRYGEDLDEVVSLLEHLVESSPALRDPS
jgi:hypothetical protein